MGSREMRESGDSCEKQQGFTFRSGRRTEEQVAGGRNRDPVAAMSEWEKLSVLPKGLV